MITNPDLFRYCFEGEDFVIEGGADPGANPQSAPATTWQEVILANLWANFVQDIEKIEKLWVKE